MSNWDHPRTVEHRRTSLAFAVRLVDAFTGDEPATNPDLALETVSAEPVANPSGYHLFLDLDEDVESVTLHVDGGDEYVDQTWTVVLAGEPPEDAADRVFEVIDPAEPLVVELTPTPAYAFPSSTTTVRGHVEAADGTPVPGARVRLREFEPVVETSAQGEYALWVPVSAANVVRRDGQNYVVVDGDGGGDANVVANGGRGADPTLVLTMPDGTEHTEQLAVPAGARTAHHVTLE